MTGITLLLAAAAVGLILARLLDAPPIPLLIASGVVLARLGSLPDAVLDDALILGVAFLAFAMGLELDPRRVRVQRRAVLLVGVIQFVVLLGLGLGAALALGFAPGEAAFVALALPASSTLVAVRILQRRRQLYEPFGRLVLGVLLLQDVLVILLVPVVLRAGEGWASIGAGVASVVLLGAGAVGVRALAPRVLLRLQDESEAVLLVALSVLFAFVEGARFLGLPEVVGGFLAGAGLARFPVNGVVRAQLVPLRDFFAALFFTGLGALVGLPSAGELIQAALLILLVVLVTPPLVAAVARRTGFSGRSALEAGLLLSQTSEISLVVGLTGVVQGQLGESLFVVLALVALVTMLLTPLISTDGATRAFLRLAPRRREVPGVAPTGHVLVVGAGATGMPLVEDLILEGEALAVIDEDPGVVAGLRAAGIHAVRGNASDPEVLEAAGLSRARVVCSTARRIRDNEALLGAAPGIPVLVRVLEESDGAWVRTRGGEPILYTDAAVDDLMAWMDAAQSGTESP